MEKKRENWLDIAKGIAIIFVVLGHISTSYVNSGYKENILILKWIYNIAYGFHMPLFFVVAGILAEKSSSQSSIGKQIWKKVIAYGVPYVAFSVADFVFKSVAGSVTNSNVTITELFQIPIVPIGPLWYLYALMIISVIHILLKRMLCENRGAFKIVLAFVGVLYIVAKVLPQIEGFKGTLLSQSILMDIPRGYLWYLCGVLWGEAIAAKAKDIKFAYVLIPVYAILINLGIGGIFTELFFAAFGIFLTICCSMKLSENKTLLCLGKNTLPIYLLHGYFIAAIRVVLTKLSLPMVSGLVPAVVCGILATVLPFLVYSVVIKRVAIFDFWLYPGKYLNKKNSKQ